VAYRSLMSGHSNSSSSSNHEHQQCACGTRPALLCWRKGAASFCVLAFFVMGVVVLALPHGNAVNVALQDRVLLAAWASVAQPQPHQQPQQPQQQQPQSQQQPQQHAPGPLGMNWPQKLKSKSCIFDSVMATLSLTNAGTGLKRAVTDCKHRNERLCAADTASIVGALSGVGSFFSSAIYECTHSVGAQCAKSVLLLTQALASFVQSASLASISCMDNQTQSKEKMHEYLGGQNFSLFDCVVDSAHSAYSLSMAGKGVLSASKSCGVEQQHKCSTDALYIVNSLVHSAGCIATAVNDCRPHDHGSARCATQVTSLVGSLGMIASMAYSTVESCNATQRPAFALVPVAPVVGKSEGPAKRPSGWEAP